jgi:hypothetical protein
MAIIALPNLLTDGTLAVGSQVYGNDNAIVTDYNGNITNANISASASIADTKLAQITTAGKVSGTALTGLASLPAGAGVIPAANIPTFGSVTSSFKKLKIVYASAATVTVTADEIMLNNSTKISSVNFTCNIAGAVGLNGLDTGTEASDSWYYIYAVDASHGFLSTSATSPTTGVVGTVYALVGCVRNTSGDFVSFTQYGRKYFYTAWLAISSGQHTGSWLSVDTTAFVPSALSYYAFGNAWSSSYWMLANSSSVSQNISVTDTNRFASNPTAGQAMGWALDILTANTLYSYSGSADYVNYIQGFEITNLT